MFPLRAKLKFLVFLMPLIVVLISVLTGVSVSVAETCGRVDLRSALIRAGFPEIRNRGGRLDGFSFAASEMVGLEATSPISARWLEHWLERHNVSGLQRFQKTFAAILEHRLRPCLETSVPSEDIESTRLARLKWLGQAKQDLDDGGLFESLGIGSIRSVLDILSSREFAAASISPFACDIGGRSALEKKSVNQLMARLHENKNALLGVDSFGEPSDASLAIDGALRANRLAVIFVGERSSFESKTNSVVGRRLSLASGRCEYLVRTYSGPSCSGQSRCEDGSVWIDRRTLAKQVERIWSLR